MAFLIYFFVLLVSAASVMFGLDLISRAAAAHPECADRPQRASYCQAADPAGQKQEADAQVKAVEANERALTPVYPTSPGMSQAQVQQAETTGSAPQEQAALEPRADQDLAFGRAAARAAAGSEAANSCNAQACYSAYQSFRASDCTYQPFEGPRRLCTSGAATVATQAPKPQQQAARKPAGRDELREVERIARRQPLQLVPPVQRVRATPEISEAERIVRHMTRDEAADIPVQDADGRVFIVRKSYR